MGGLAKIKTKPGPLKFCSSFFPPPFFFRILFFTFIVWNRLLENSLFFEHHLLFERKNVRESSYIFFKRLEVHLIFFYITIIVRLQMVMGLHKKWYHWKLSNIIFLQEVVKRQKKSIVYKWVSRSPAFPFKFQVFFLNLATSE